MRPVTLSPPDYVLFGIAMLLSAIGVVAVYSASYPKIAAEVRRATTPPPVPGQPATTASSDIPTPLQIELTVREQQAMLRRQLKWVGLGLCCLWIGMSLPYGWLSHRGLLNLALLATLVLLALVKIIGTTHGRGCERWLDLGPVTVQPSELAKFTLVAWLAGALGRLGLRSREVPEFTMVMCVVGAVVVLVLVQPHLGATLVILGAAFAVLWAGGTDLRHLAVVGVLAVLLGLLSVASHGYQGGRLKAWLHPEQNQVLGYQTVHCGSGFARGGLIGRGLGRSIEKFHYLPEPYTDSILAVIAEETGFRGTALLLLLFVGLADRGLRIAWRCRDPFGKLLAVGITAALFLQALLNFGVTSGLLPQTGVGLPFISYGGSSLCCFLGAVGLLLNVCRQADLPDRHQPELTLRGA
ncbi:MAG: FtsW/RodA/SpoVE family cell cycle protein [Fimbriimonadaceae bacterium]|nr:FtsW/RodA/SpoVE family cell cycle protein [Fimbriimonadaceae bacterium]